MQNKKKPCKIRAKFFRNLWDSFGFQKNKKRPQTQSYQGFQDFQSETIGCWKWRRWEYNYILQNIDISTFK